MVVATLDFSGTRQPVSLWATGDWHLGSREHDAQLFEAHFARAVRERWVLLHVGDALEMVTPTSRVAQRGALAEQILGPEEQRELLVNRLRQLRSRGVILGGNHELRVDAATGLDFIKTVTDAVGGRIEPLALPGIVRLLVGRQTYHVYIHHGEGPVVSPVTLFDRIQRDVEGIDAICAGHIHASTFDPAERESPDGDRAVQRIRIGHYLKTPRYALQRPIARRGARGSWLLSLHPKEHRLASTWLALP